MTNSADPDQLASVCKARVYAGSAGLGLSPFQDLFKVISRQWKSDKERLCKVMS